MSKTINDIFLFDILKNDIVKINKNSDKFINVLDKIYFGQMRLPTELEIEINYIAHTKKELSKIEDKIPLYDIYTENIYLIKKYNVYLRVVHQHYRFPEHNILKELINKKEEYKSNMDILDKLLLRKIRKLDLMIDFMKCFDLDILFDTYVKVFYKYSSLAGKEQTVCKNKSFVPQFFHIKPYLTRSEVINSALNFGLHLPNKYIEPEEINNLCKKISKYQLDSNVLLEHQHHILNSGNLGLVQYYTLQGSFFMNQYLRIFTNYKSKNEYLEKLIEPMWELILTTPKFDKPYTFYRFINKDDYLQHLQIGDEYVESGFMSTTRDPFYRADLYKFGFILIKIKVPSGKNGVALCLETISHFPDEQEIIFPPNTKFKLVSKDENCKYYHTDINFSSKVKTRYEFEWVGNSEIGFDRIKDDTVKTYDIDFLRLQKINAVTLNEKLKQFDNLFVDKFGQFRVVIGKKEITIITEWFDGTGAYKKFYALETKTGYAMYSMYKGYMLFYIELAELQEGKQMHVNYYMKYSSVDPNKVIGNDNLIKFFSSVAHYFDISNVVIYANYLNCNTTLVQSGGVIQRGFDSKEQITNYEQSVKKNIPTKFNLIGGSYCSDLYQYLDTGIKKYSEDNILNQELIPKFSYHDLNLLKSVSPTQILVKDDRDEIYQLYDKYYKNFGKDDSIASFYLWLVKENKCYLLDLFIQKIDKILSQKNNPFKNDIYILDASTYLYNRKYINSYPINISILDREIKRDIIGTDLQEQKIYNDRTNKFR
jgi:hypothetical protein